MTDYYKLFDYCQKTTIENDLKKDRLKKNKESRQKKFLFKTITENAYNIIKNYVDDGNDYAIIYESEYNKLINELMDSLILHFKPFNVIYKKKSNLERGLLEVLKDESNYVIIIDWNIIKTNSEKNLNSNNTIVNETENDNNKSIHMINQNIDNKTVDTDIINNEIIDKIVNDEKSKKKDNLLEKLGFETIF